MSVYCPNCDADDVGISLIATDLPKPVSAQCEGINMPFRCTECGETFTVLYEIDNIEGDGNGYIDDSCECSGQDIPW